MPDHCAALPARGHLRDAYEKCSGSSAQGDTPCTQGERSPTFCGEVTFALSLVAWGGFGHTSVGSKNGGRIQRKGEKYFPTESSIGET